MDTACRTLLRATLLLVLLALMQDAFQLEARGLSRARAPEKVKKKEEEPVVPQVGKLKLAAQKMLVEGEGQRMKDVQMVGATQQQVLCPVCSQSFGVLQVPRQPLQRGIDRDFYRHHMGLSELDFDVWCCPSCGYANFSMLFALPVDPVVKDHVNVDNKTLLQDMFKEQMGVDITKFGFILDQTDIPSSIKYEMMNRILHLYPLGAYRRYRFYLQYAWIERSRLLAPIQNTSLSVAISILNHRLEFYKKEMDQKEITSDPQAVLDFFDTVEGERKLDAEDRVVLAIYQAGQADRLGNPRHAMELLKKAEKLHINKEVLQTLRAKRVMLQHEYELIKEALMALRECFVEPQAIETSRWPEHIYLVGELSRRLGLFEEARIWLKQVQSIIEDGHPLKAWAREQLEVLPEAILNLASGKELESERTLVETLCAQYRLRRDKEGPAREEEHEVSQIGDWLFVLNEAVQIFRREFDIYPGGIDELIEVGLLKTHAGLEKIAGKKFHLVILPVTTSSKIEYFIFSKDFYMDEQGKYWPSINSLKSIEQLRQKPNIEEKHVSDL